MTTPSATALGAPSHTRRRYALLACVVALLALAGSARAAAAGAAWQVFSTTDTAAAPGGALVYNVRVQNVGDAASSGAVTLTIALPDGILASSILAPGGWSCDDGSGGAIAGSRTVVCAYSSNVAAHMQIVGAITLTTAVSRAASGTLVATFDATGGALEGRTVDPTRIDTAPVGFGVDAFDGNVSDAIGDAYTQAGGHPYEATTTIDFNRVTNTNPLIGTAWPVAPAKDVIVDLPPGFVGDPTVAEKCTVPQLSQGGTDPKPLCPTGSQVGTMAVVTNGGNVVGNPIPVYNMVPPPGAPASFAFNVLGTVVTLDAQLRSESDYGLSVVVSNIPEGLATVGTSLTFWGVPAASSHDNQRSCPGEHAPPSGGATCSTETTPKAFLRNPTECTEPGVGLPTRLSVDSWFDPGNYVTDTIVSHLPNGYPYPRDQWGRAQGPTGCDKVPFDPTLRGRPDAGAEAGKPSGFSFDLSLPQSDDPTAIGESDLRKAVVKLPEGVRVSPASADGLGACTPGQIGLDNRDDPTCPDASRIGSVTIDTPLLDQEMTGSVYLATPFNNPFNSLLAIYLVARGPGLIVKLPGQIATDPSKDGQLTATFDNQPQLPFTNLHLEFKSGARAPMVLPKSCGRYTTVADMTGWNGKEVTSTSSFTIDKGCGSGFTPGWSAGSENPVAGASSPFLLRLTRDDSDELLSGLTVNMPPGLLGHIADVVLCGAVDAAHGTCPEGTRVGSVTVGAGAGTNPFYITNGRAYITGPYKGAPFGLSIVVPAVAGPFDLGNVNVRAALYVDKHDATLRVVSDPLPTILRGIPLDVRDVRVSVNRDGFMVNPTSCAEKSVGGTITSTAGSTANVSSRFQVGDCGSLSLKPKMRIFVGRRGRTHRNAVTPFTTALKLPAGGANLRYVKVSLPTTLNARLNVVNRACTRAEFEAGNCAKAKAGTAYAITPLLRDPLRGGVYFVRNGHAIPDLFVALRGQVDFDLIGRVTIPGGTHLATTFDAVPDVPVTKFVLRLQGGKNGPVGAAQNLCTKTGHRTPAAVDYIGQNGKVVQVDQRLHVRGCAKHKARKAAHRRGK